MQGIVSPSSLNTYCCLIRHFDWILLSSIKFHPDFEYIFEDYGNRRQSMDGVLFPFQLCSSILPTKQYSISAL